jgi:hypothetical protein
MRIFSLLIGLAMIAVGIVAIFEGDLWDGGPWILAAAATIAGLSGLVSAFSRSRQD